jgi:hypothetical protein
MNLVKFEVGKVYSTRSSCDSNCIFSYTVISRTDKSIVIAAKGETKTVRRKIHISDNVEWIYPSGIYSMCPIIRANR